MSKSFIAVIKHDDGTFSGLEQIYHPKPSGCDRWIDGLEDSRHWSSSEIAIEEMKNCIRGLLKIKKLKPYKLRFSELLEE